MRHYSLPHRKLSLPRRLFARLIVACCLFAQPALADQSRLLLIDPDPELTAALEAGLRAWATTVIVQRASGPGNTMPGSAEDARQRADRHGVQAVVWISNAPDGTALWVYDARSDRVLARKLATPPPFDEATAASVALTVKTLLRHSAVPPRTERAAVPPPQSDTWLRTSLHAGLRVNATRPGAAELRLGVGASVWPWSFAGVGLDLTSGPGVGVDEPSFTGRWTETVLLATLHFRRELTPAFDLSLLPAAGVNLSSMTGVVSEPREVVSSTRLSAVAALHTELGVRLNPALRSALRLGASIPARTQTYLVHERAVFWVNDPMLSALLVLEADCF